MCSMKVRGLSAEIALLPPAPNGPLGFRVECRNLPDRGGPSAHHSVELGPQWDLHTPHDLEAERVARAFGASISCLELEESVIPAARELVNLRTRAVLPGLRRTKQGWGPTKVAKGCCDATTRPGGFRTAQTCAEHLRGTQHMAARAKVDRKLLTTVVAAVERAHRGDPAFSMATDDIERVAHVVSGRGGAIELWEAGLHPRLVLLLHERLDVGGTPLPVAFYTGAAFNRVDLDWAKNTVGHAVNSLFIEDLSSLAEWAVWTPEPFDLRHPNQRRDLLDEGWPRSIVHRLSRAGIDAQTIGVLPDISGLTRQRAAVLLLDWVEAGAVPDVERIASALRAGVNPWHRPSAAAVKWVQTHFGHDNQPDPLDVIAAIALSGSRSDAVFWIRQGVIDPVELADRVREVHEKFPTIQAAHNSRRLNTDAP